MKRNTKFQNTKFSSNYGTNLTKESNTFMFKDKNSKVVKESNNNVKSNKELEAYFYFNHILQNFKAEISNEEKEIFFHNVLNQTEGQELQLSCRKIPSHCIELTLNGCNDPNILIRFMKAFSENFEEACGNCFASHVTETLLYHGLKIMRTWSSDIDAKDKNTEKADSIISVILWIHNLAEFCLQNLQTCLEDTYGCHVLKTVIHVLGGYFISDFYQRNNRKIKEQKKNTEEGYYDKTSDVKVKEDIVLIAVPKFFIETLKNIAKSIIKLKNVIDCAIQAETAPIIQVLLFVLKKRLPKCCRKLISIFSSKLFDAKTEEGVAEALLHKNCSYVVEKIFSCAAEEQQQELWQIQVEPFLKTLIKHHVGNFVLQRMFEVIENKQQFELMCTSLFKYFNVIYDSRHYGLWVSIAKTCHRLKAQQAHYMTCLVQCLEAGNKQDGLLKLLLSLKQEECFMKNDASTKPPLTITLHGSLIAQSVLNFQKPLKIVNSILQMKPEELAYLARHIQGCHVLLSFFDSPTVGEKNKDNLLSIIRPMLIDLACDRSGNLTLSRMWMLMTIKQRRMVAEELIKDEYLLQQNPQGFGVSKKFRLFQYKSRRDEWEVMQKNLSKKRKLLPFE